MNDFKKQDIFKMNLINKYLNDIGVGDDEMKLSLQSGCRHLQIAVFKEDFVLPLSVLRKISEIAGVEDMDVYGTLDLTEIEEGMPYEIEGALGIGIDLP